METQIIRKKVIWKVENFNRDTIGPYGNPDESHFISDNFEISINGRIGRYNVYIAFKHNDVYLEYFETKYENGPKLGKLKCKIYILRHDNTQRLIHRFTRCFCKNDEFDVSLVKEIYAEIYSYGNEDACLNGVKNAHSENLKRQDLLDESRNDSITFVFDFAIEDMTEKFKDKMRKREETPANSYIEAISKYFNSDIFSDFTIVCNDGLEIPVHRVIIAARSDVFGAMLQIEMVENKTRKLIIDDIDGPTMLEVLRYIYGGKFGISSMSIATDLMYAAEKYNLKELKSLCVAKMIQKISVTNVLELLMIANNYSAANLELECLEYIKMNFNNLSAQTMCDLQRSEEWKELDCKLILKILKSAKNFSKNVIHLISEF